ncbi:MAG: DUF4924 family protein [Bacteroidota bacterium]
MNRYNVSSLFNYLKQSSFCVASFVFMSSIPAEIKKRENIAEYIIHMYQTEDLILSYDFNLDEINQYIIQHMSKDKQMIKKILLWYAGIIDNMKSEGITNSSKRLSTTQAYVDQLTKIHKSLLKEDLSYTSVFKKAEADVNEHIKLSANTVTNPIQICINGLYGMLLLKLNGKKILEADEAKLEKFGAVLAYLSDAFNKVDFI